MIFKAISLVLLFSIVYPDVFDGLTLFSVYSDEPDESNHYTILMDNDENIIQFWSHNRGAASMSYLLSDSTLIYPYRQENPSMCNGGVGGGISRYSWDGDLIWSYEFSSDVYQHHHDIQPIPNGNILILAWERHTETQSFDTEFYGGEGYGWAELGRSEVNNPLNQMWSEAIFEIEMVNNNEVNIIWEWHLWDHLIQDADSSLSNYGTVSNHPELMNINFGAVGDFDGMCGPQADWIHFNAIDYNPYLDQIVLSSRYNSEIYILDHSTTTEEAAGHSGGSSRKGGDFLYRWGNPEVYNQGNSNNRKLDGQHGINWINEGYPGSGNLIVYNNFHGDWQSLPLNDWESAVYELVPPLNNDGVYDLSIDGTYGPTDPIWSYTGDFFSFIQSGVFRLPNGNTLITVTNESRMFEINDSNSVVWEHQLEDGEMIARAQKYSMNHFTSLDSYENPFPRTFTLYENYPNPFNSTTAFNYSIAENILVNISVHDISGRLVKSLFNGLQSPGDKKIRWDSTNNEGLPVSGGFYFYSIRSDKTILTKKMVFLK